MIPLSTTPWRRAMPALMCFGFLVATPSCATQVSNTPSTSSNSSSGARRSASRIPDKLKAQVTPSNVAGTIPVTVRETAGIKRRQEILRSGVPVPRSFDWKGSAKLAVLDGQGNRVAATFRVQARYNAGRSDAKAPIQWLLVAFPVDVDAGQTKIFRVVQQEAETKAQPLLTVSQNGNQVTVDTKAAVFKLGGQADAVFDLIQGPDKTELARPGKMSIQVDGKSFGHTGRRSVRVVHQDALSAVVVVEGRYDMPGVGGGGIGSRRRYVFRAGSPTVTVQQRVAFEGDICKGGGGFLSCDKGINGLLINQIRQVMLPGFGATSKVLVAGRFDDPMMTGTQGPASIRQLRRKDRTSDLRFEMNVGAKKKDGDRATGGMLAVLGEKGGLGIALESMDRYEPQALRVLADGSIAIDIADDGIWLGARQGMFARYAVSALSASTTQDELYRTMWAPLNRPLRAWPTADHFAASGAVDEFPVGEISGPLSDYDQLVRGGLVTTAEQVDERGLSGLMTFGLYPRIWASVMLGDELDCDDPTPDQDWDKLYWCGTWTDYHNTLATVPTWAMRSGEVEWLDELSEPGALRQLNTQIFQCAPGDDYFYCGQAPTGYGGYRADFNSSHAYFENLFLYYWLTGDETVIETIKGGADQMRTYFCPRRPRGKVCKPKEARTDDWSRVTGRSGAQWVAVLRFIGLASDDASFLDDWRSHVARGVTQHYVQLKKDGKNYGFWLTNERAVTKPGDYWTDQLWMASIYDMNILYRWQIETNDQPVGEPAVRASEVQAAWARTMAEFGPTLVGGGTWPNMLEFSWSGRRVGGQLKAISANVDPDNNGRPCDAGDECMWDTGKAAVTGALARGGHFGRNKAALDLARDLAADALSRIGDENNPLSKQHGLYWARLHAAVARLK